MTCDTRRRTVTSFRSQVSLDMHVRWPTLVLSLVFVGAAGTAHAERPSQLDTTRSDRVTLQYSFERGAARTFVLQAEERIEGLDGTSGDVTDFVVTAPVLWEVQNIDAEGVAEVAMSVAAIEPSLTVDGEAESTREIVEALAAARFSLRLRRSGDNEEFTASVGRDSSRADAGAFVSDLLRSAWVEFPAEPVGIGDSWLQTIPLAMSDVENRISATLTVRYTLVGFALVNEVEQAVIDAELTTVIDGQQPLGNDLAMRIIGRGNGDGYIVFDHRAGAITEVGADNGLILTFIDPADQRTALAISSTSTLTAQPLVADAEEGDEAGE